MYYLFKLLPNINPELAQLELEKKGLQDTFIIEDQDVYIGGHSEKEITTDLAILIEQKENTVNWEEQWSQFAENFHEGKAHIKVGDKTLELLPGPGFGDLSHPTTALMLEMMQSHVQNEHIVDIGSGSGVLTLAALLLRAKSAIGIDIDEEAINHAKENAKLNHLDASFSKELPKLHPQSIFLMNMIFPEQQEVHPENLNKYARCWIISGILASERNTYLKQAKKWGWKLSQEFQRADWLGFIFFL